MSVNKTLDFLLGIALFLVLLGLLGVFYKALSDEEERKTEEQMIYAREKKNPDAFLYCSIPKHEQYFKTDSIAVWIEVCNFAKYYQADSVDIDIYTTNRMHTKRIRKFISPSWNCVQDVVVLPASAKPKKAIITKVYGKMLDIKEIE